MALNKAKTVYVGMSGGVDSSVSAALLKEQGFNVVGVFIKSWEPEGWDCGWREDRRDAMRVAAVLGIPFLTLDLAQAYKEKVIDYMLAEYRAGRTPNPDVMCNRAIKFGLFYEQARAAGADFVATGHYARIFKFQISNVKSESEKLKAENYEFLAGTDKNKDQSYFLWQIKKEQLPYIMFPVGHLAKPEVRKLAEKFALPNQAKKDSQGLCFVGKLDVKEFLRGHIEEEPGKVLDQAGKVIGCHSGALLFTLGERHGFRIEEKQAVGKPLYVLAKNAAENTITVGPEEALSQSGKTEIRLEQLNWLADAPLPDRDYGARVRYRQPLQACRVENIDGRWLIKFQTPQTAAPGQSAVIYDGEICLGGGVISQE